MGRGLAAILQNTDTAVADSHGQDGYREVAVDLISPNPNQPRRVFEQDALSALAGSIETQGLLQPVLVRPSGTGTYERDDAAALEAALVENMAREDLNPVEEARAVAGLVEELGLSREDVGKRIGRGRVAVSNLLRLLDLPDDVLVLLEQRKLSEGHGRALLTAPDNESRRKLAREAVEGGWSVRALEERARTAAGRTTMVRSRTIHPDQLAAAEEIGEVLSRAIGAEVRVRAAAGGYRASLPIESVEQATELAERLARSR